MPTRIALFGLIAALALSAAGAGVADAASTPAHARLNTTAVRHDTAVSSNWSGYVVAGDPAATKPARFTHVSSRWVQPKATCSVGSQAFSAFWVGLGGSSETSQGLEQIGSEADCSASGRATYSLWYELLPAASVTIKLKVRPGNVVAASVTVKGSKVTLQIRDLSRKTKFTKVVHMSAPDTSSAEWVAEAPSTCNVFGRCVVLPLANFGSVAFTRATATANGHAGTINDTAWSATLIQLLSEDMSGVVDPSQSGNGATPSTLSTDGSAFSISYQAAATS